MRRRPRTGRGRALGRAVAPVLLVLAAAVFLAHAVLTVVGPATLAQQLGGRLQRLRGRFVAEDVLRRALDRPLLRSGLAVAVREGELSRHPGRLARVEMRRSGGTAQLLCRLARGRRDLVYVATCSRGALPPAFSWAVGQGEDVALGDDVLVRGRNGLLSRDPDSPNAYPFAIRGAWDVAADLEVRASLLAERSPPAAARNLGSFRLGPELPLEYLAEPTDLDDFALGSGRAGRLVAAFRAKQDLAVRVHGHLWVGRPGATLLVGTGGHTVTILVTGNVYVLGSLRMLGPRDRLVLVAGRPGWPAYRDRNANGRRDPGEDPVACAGIRAPVSPREGGGLVYLGRRDTRPSVQASLLANHDVIVGEAGASVLGACLAAGRLVRAGRRPGRLELRAETRSDAAWLPCHGLPLLPRSRDRERITAVRFVAARPAAAKPGRP